METIEQEARRRRTLLLGPISDNGWEKCKDFWIKDINWLRSSTDCNKMVEEINFVPEAAPEENLNEKIDNTVLIEKANPCV